MREAPQRDRLWQLIGREIRSNGRFPAPHQLRTLLGVSEGRVRQLLHALEEQGVLEHRSLGRGRSPEIRLTPVGVTHLRLGVPIVGHIRGGLPDEAHVNIEGYINIPAEPGCFALRVAGDSMAQEILDGDIVFLKPNLKPQNGHVCAIRIGHGDTTLKRFYRRGRMARLEPSNSDFETITVLLQDIQIEGQMVGLIRGEVAMGFFRSPLI